ncbi:MAG TPA: SPOR domain-containing protein [Phenylobacterium sp.]|nr:SPOR domain-containing protein [Phenylobacterium sp.]
MRRAAPTVTAVVGLKASASGAPPAVQVAAHKSIAEAVEAFSAMEGLLVDPLRTEIQPAVSGDAVYYRALVVGFASRADATAFCGRWTRQGGACFVR